MVLQLVFLLVPTLIWGLGSVATAWGSGVIGFPVSGFGLWGLSFQVAGLRGLQGLGLRVSGLRLPGWSGVSDFQCMFLLLLVSTS